MKPCPAVIGTYTISEGQRCFEPCQAFSITGLMLITSINSGLRRLLPKPLTDQHAYNPLAPRPLSLQNPQHAYKLKAINDTCFAVGSAQPLSLAPGEAYPVQHARIASGTMALRGQEHGNGRAKPLVSPDPKVFTSRVQKPEKRQARAPKTVVACANCR